MIRPIVIHRKKQRKGKGFSLAELKVVNLDRIKAKKLKIPIDERRKTALEININMLKEFLKESEKNVQKEK